MIIVVTETKAALQHFCPGSTCKGKCNAENLTIPRHVLWFRSKSRFFGIRDGYLNASIIFSRRITGYYAHLETGTIEKRINCVASRECHFLENNCKLRYLCYACFRRLTIPNRTQRVGCIDGHYALKMITQATQLQKCV